ncbi:MAG: nucleoside phosphorylase [Bacteroidia bacterium]
MRISETDLILNKDGSVYHLHLLPSDIAGTVILVGDPGRVPQVSKFFDKVELKKHKREFVTHTGFIGKKRISVVSTGIGTDNIDIVLNELDALVNIDLEKRNIHPKKKSLQLIRIGTSGALQKEIPVDSLVVSAFGLGLDNLMHFYQTNFSKPEKSLMKEISKQFQVDFLDPYLVSTQGKLIDKFSDFQSGITATCSGFYGPQGRVLRADVKIKNILDRLQKINCNGLRVTNFEMETSAIYGLAKILGHEALSVNSIVANRITKQFSKKAKVAMDKTIKTVLERI